MTFIDSAVIWIYKHRILSAFLICCLALASFAASKFAKFSENIFDLLPVSDVVIENHIAFANAFKQSDTLYFNVSGANAASAAEKLARVLDASALFANVVGAAPVDSIESGIETLVRYAPNVFDESAQTKLADSISPQKIGARMDFFKRKMGGFGSPIYKKIFLSDSANTLQFASEKLKSAAGNFDFASMQDGLITDASGANFLILAQGKFPSSDSAKSAALVAEVEKLLTPLRSEFAGANIAWCGGYRVSADNAKIARADSARCLFATLALMFLLCMFSFRNRLFAPCAMLPSLIGTSCGFAAMCLIYPHISTIAIAFASIAVGVSIDYAVHILYHLDSKHNVELSDAIAVAQKYKKPVTIVAGTTMAAFVIMYFSGCAEFAQLGAFGAMGVFFSAVASVVLLPPFVVGFSSKRKSARLFDIVSARIFKAFESRAKLSAGIALILCIIAIPFACRLSFDGKISSFNSLTPAARTDDAIVKNVWKNALSKKLVAVSAKDLDGALALNAKLADWLENSGMTNSVNSIATFLPSAADAKNNRLRWNKFWAEHGVEFKKSFVDCARPRGINADAFSDRLDAAVAAVNPSDVSEISSIISDPSPLAKLFSSRIASSETATIVSTFVELKDGVDAHEFSEKLTESFPSASYIDMNFMGERITSLAAGWLLKFSLISFAAVSIYLYILLRRAAFVGGVLAPVVVGLLWTFAIMGACGISVNLINVIFIIFAVCVAQDYAVFMLSARGKISAQIHTLAAVLISAATTGAAFGALAFATHPVLRGLGQAAVISIFSILCACILIVPQISKSLNKNAEQ